MNVGGKVALGEVVRGSPYFHFYIDQADTAELTLFLKKYGTVTISGVSDHRPLVSGRVRWILWMDSQEPPLPADSGESGH